MSTRSRGRERMAGVGSVRGPFRRAVWQRGEAHRNRLCG